MTTSENIKVIVRVRPPTVKEGDEYVNVDSLRQVTLRHPPLSCRQRKRETKIKTTSFTFDAVLPGDASQEAVFDHCRSLVDAALDGFNATVFAHGVTGSGKTFTIGGIVPRIVTRVFEGLVAKRSCVSIVHLTVVELYNDRFWNLLSPSGDYSQVEIHESASRGVHLLQRRGSELSSLRRTCGSADDMASLIRVAMRARARAATALNTHSSRSHCILQIEIESTRNDGQGDVAMGKLSIVDLDGAERVKVSGSSGATLIEAQNINKSLAALGNVLDALSSEVGSSSSSSSKKKQPAAAAADSNDENVRSGNDVLGGQGGSAADGERDGKRTSSSRRFIPYRDSKLTFLLKDSLGGNSKTLMIANIRCQDCFNMTLMSLRYASRARDIKNAPARRIERGAGGADGSELRAYVNRIASLQSQLAERAAEFEVLSRSSDAGNSQIAELRARHADEKREMELQLQNVVHAKDSKLAEEQRACHDLQIAMDDALSTARNEKQGMEAERQSCLAMVKSLARERSRLKGKLSAAEDRIGSLVEEASAKATEADGEKEASEGKSKRVVQKLIALIKQLECERDRLKEQCRLEAVRSEAGAAERVEAERRERLAREETVRVQRRAEEEKTAALEEERLRGNAQREAESGKLRRRGRRAETLLEQATAQLEESAGELCDLRRGRDEVESRRAALAAELEQTVHDREHRIALLEDAWTNNRQSLEVQLSAAAEASAGLEAQVGRLGSELAAAASDAARRSLEGESAAAKIVETERARMKATQEAHEGELEKLRARVLEEQKARDASVSDARRLREQHACAIEALRADMRERKRISSGAEAAAVEAKESAEALLAHAKHSAREREGLQGQLAETASALRENEQREADLRQALTKEKRAAEQDATERQARFDTLREELEAQVRSLQKARDAGKQTNLELEAQLERVRATAADDIARLTSTLTSVESELSDAKSTQESIQDRADDHAAALAEAAARQRENIDDADARIAGLESQARQARQEREAADAAWKEERGSHAAAVEELTARTEAAEQQLQRAREALEGGRQAWRDERRALESEHAAAAEEEEEKERQRATQEVDDAVREESAALEAALSEALKAKEGGQEAPGRRPARHASLERRSASVLRQLSREVVSQRSRMQLMAQQCEARAADEDRGQQLQIGEYRCLVEDLKVQRDELQEMLAQQQALSKRLAKNESNAREELRTAREQFHSDLCRAIGTVRKHTLAGGEESKIGVV